MIAKKILSNTSIQIFGRVVNAIISLYLIKVITSFLSLQDYGYYTGVYDFLAFFGIVADLGLFTLAVREMGRKPEDSEHILANILGMRVALALFCMLIAIVLAFSLPAHTGTPMGWGISMGSLAVFLAITQGTISSVLQVNLEMKWVSLSLILGKIFNFIWILLTVYVFHMNPADFSSFYILMIGGIIGNAFSLLATFLFARKKIPIRIAFHKDYWKKTFRETWAYGLAIILGTIYFRMDGLMLLYMVGPEQAAYYGPAVRVIEVISVISVYFLNSVLPVLSRSIEKPSSDIPSPKEIIEKSFHYMSILVAPMVIGLSLCSRPIIQFIGAPSLLGDPSANIFGADASLQILAFAMGFSFLNSIFSYALIAHGQQNKILLVNGLAVLFNFFSNLWIIPFFLGRGAAFTSVLTELLVLLVSYLLLRKYLSIPFRWGFLLKVGLSSAFMGLTVFKSLTFLPLPFVIVLGIVVYLFAFFGLKTASHDDVEAMRKLFRKNA